MIGAPELGESHQRLPVAAMIDMVFLIVFYFLAVGAVGQDTSALELQLAELSGQGPGGVLEIGAEGGLTFLGAAIGEPQLRAMISDGSLPRSLLVRVHDAARHDAVTRVLEYITLAGGEPRLELAAKGSPTPSPVQ